MLKELNTGTAITDCVGNVPYLTLRPSSTLLAARVGLSSVRATAVQASKSKHLEHSSASRLKLRGVADAGEAVGAAREHDKR